MNSNMTVPCGQATKDGTPCKNKKQPHHHSCGASHGGPTPIDLMAALKESIAKQKGADVASADPFASPDPAVWSSSQVARAADDLAVARARVIAMKRAATNMTASQLTARNARGKGLAAEVSKTLQNWRNADPVAATDTSPEPLPVVDLAEDLSPVKTAGVASTYLQRAVRKAHRAAWMANADEREALLSSAHTYAIASHQLFEFARQDTHAMELAGVKADVADPDTHRRQAAKAATEGWADHGRHAGRANAAAAAERLRQTDTHLRNALLGYGEIPHDIKPPVLIHETRDDLHDAYKTHSKSLRSVLADDAVDVSHDDGINPDGTLHDGMEAYTDADITRLQQARLHTTHAIHLLEQYVAHPDHQPAT